MWINTPVRSAECRELRKLGTREPAAVNRDDQAVSLSCRWSRDSETGTLLCQWVARGRD